MNEARMAELQYSKEHGRIEVILPYGTRLADFNLNDAILRDALAKLPRGCPACTSGDNLIIRERLENVIRVDLDSGQIFGP